ncbi:MAG: hypothetical protein FWE21_03900 [Defluviitaleaceae bacterium]|nr:hypothetical protein [Defluviitaleaceae bacterium]
MGKKPIKCGHRRRLQGLIMLVAAGGMIFTWFFLGASFVVAAVLLVLGFYFLFM